MPHPQKTLASSLLVLLSGSLLLLLSCSADPNDAKTPCVDDSKACGETCKKNSACPSDLYCAGSGVCAKACDFDHPCEDGEACSSRGECLGVAAADGGSDGSSIISGGGMVEASDAQVSDASDPGVCADVDVQANRVTPRVFLIVDQSGSMVEPFGDGTRWNVLRDFLLDESGLIADLQKQVKFGLALYSSRSIPDGTAVDGECPIVSRVAPKLQNYDAIAEAYNAAEPIKETPTGDSIQNVLDSLNLDETDPDTQEDPTVFILATDGEPDRCEDPNPGDEPGRAIARQETIDAVKNAFKLGVRTFIISVGEATVSEEHQQAVANAGVGHKAGQAEAEFWVAGDDATLRSALQKIVGAQLSCDIKLQGKVDESVACDGKVLLGGTKLECNDPDGWKLLDPSHIRLQGAACKKLKQSQSASLHVTFPCGTPILF